MDFLNISTLLNPCSHNDQFQVNYGIKSSDQVPLFMDMLNSENSDHEEFATPTPNSHISQSLDEEESVEATPVSSQVFSSQKSKEKRARTKKITKQEDEMLISAWQIISQDPIKGADQTNGTYCQRVHNYYMRHKYFQSDRNISSLTHRWSIN